MGATKKTGFQRKSDYVDRLYDLIGTYGKILIVDADFVSSKQMATIRQSIRGKGEMLMGKNTMIRRALRQQALENSAIEPLIPLVKGNIGFIFTNGDLIEIRDILVENRVGAPAKAGVIAPKDVWVDKGPTGMEPTQTSFLQALNIASKINRGQIEIINDVHLIHKGEKVGSSEAALLAKLNIRPFSYGMELAMVYDEGSVYSPAVLDLSDDDIVAKFAAGVANIAALGLQIGYPTIASLPHSLINGFKNLLAIAVEVDYDFEQANKIKEYLANPEAFAVAAPVTTDAPAEAAPEEEEEESDDDMGFGLFD